MTRLPVVGQDRDEWGNILVDFLRTSHKENGELKQDVIDEIRDGLITEEAADLAYADKDATEAAIADSAEDIIRLRGRNELVLFDDFSLHADGAVSGTAPAIGPNWATSGTTAPVWSSGKLTNTGDGYAYVTFTDPVQFVEVTQVFLGTTYGACQTIAWADTPFGLNNLIHLIYGASGFTLQVNKNGGTLQDVMGGVWRTNCNLDGTTPYRISVGIRGESILIIGPNGEPFSVSDPRIGQLSANRTIFLQPSESSTHKCRISTVRAIERPETVVEASELADPQDLALIAATIGPQNQIVGNLNNWYQVMIGQSPTAGAPAITFGATRVITKLTSAVAIGASTINTERPVYGADSLIINQGDATKTETVVPIWPISPLPGSGGSGTPYNQTLNAVTTKAHAAGDVVIAEFTGTRPQIYWEKFGDTLNVAGKSLNLIETLQVDGVQVVNNRKTGWAMPTGTNTRTTFDTATVSTAQLAERVKALLVDLESHGLIGS